MVVKPEGKVPLFVADQQLATLDVRYHCQLDSRGEWLAVDKAWFSVAAAIDRTPLIRFEYVRGALTVPSAHIQVHAHRGAITHLLSLSGHKSPHEMAALHIPVGGARFRPSLEDVVQFLISEFGVRAVNGWQDAVHERRAAWRRIQAAAVTRDFPEEAAEVLRRLGYQVTGPSPPPESSERALHPW